MRYTARMAVHADPMAIPWLVDLVNGWGTEPRARAGGRARPPRHAALPASAGELERIADLLYPVFAAADATEKAALVADLLARTGVRPALAGVDGRIEPRWLVPRERDALLAAAAIALRGQLLDHGPDRLGTCADAACGDAYVDASPAGHRRFCSVTCQNRARVAAFRRRRAQAD